MWNKAALTLFLANLATSVLVLSTFCFCVFSYVVESIYAKERGALDRLADSVISSIDFDDHGRADSGKPDLISSALPDESAKALLPLRLEWFNRQGALSAQKGSLEISLPFNTAVSFQTQTTPHALLLTKPAYANGELLGYVRVAEPLAAADEEVHRLATGLTVGAIAALCLSGLCITWLLKIALSPIELSVQRLRQFTADASHEFRNPLMAIKTNCSAALRNDHGMRDEDRKKFSAVVSITDDLGVLIDDLLDLARTEQGTTIETVSDTVDLTYILKGLVAQQQEISSDKSIQVYVKMPDALAVRGRSLDFRRLFGNIIENAFQYTSRNGVIEINATRDKDTTTVVVKDSGIGIDAADKAKVFDRFWRADRARSHRSGGSGLGLAIAKAIAVKYRGDISIDSTPGHGTSCRVTLNC